MCSVAVVHPSTKPIAWKIQGDIAAAGAWTDLMDAATSTGSVIVNSTLSGVFTNFRIFVTANATTGDVTTRWYVAGA